jgi:hypothetical protein
MRLFLLGVMVLADQQPEIRQAYDFKKSKKVTSDSTSLLTT